LVKLRFVHVTSVDSQAKQVEEVMNAAIAKMESLGATIEDPANIESIKLWATCEVEATDTIWTTEFKEEIARYLTSMVKTDVHNLQDIIE
jgi:hypothetical protein